MYIRWNFFKRIGLRDYIFLKACNIKSGPTYGFKFFDAWLLKKSKFFMLPCNYLLNIRGQNNKERLVLDFCDGQSSTVLLTKKYDLTYI